MNRPSCFPSVFLVFVITAMSCQIVHATKPCPPSPCFDENNKFNKAKCAQASDWVAIGRISNVRHEHTGHPLNKDFARFQFEIKQWEKAGSQPMNIIMFKVGWCQNQQELPDKVNGVFRFYGFDEMDPDGSGQYLYFEKAEQGNQE